MPIFSAIK